MTALLHKPVRHSRPVAPPTPAAAPATEPVTGATGPATGPAVVAGGGRRATCYVFAGFRLALALADVTKRSRSRPAG